MASSRRDEPTVSEILQFRERAFRKYFQNSKDGITRYDIKNESNSSQQPHWDHALGATSKRTFPYLRSSIKGFHRVSCQLSNNEALLELYDAFPATDYAIQTIPPKQYENSYYDAVETNEDVMEYLAQKDLNMTLSDIDSIRLAKATTKPTEIFQSTLHGNEKYEESEQWLDYDEKEEDFSTKIKSSSSLVTLADMAENVLRRTIMKDACALEKSCVKQLQNLHTKTREDVESNVEVSQKDLEECSEAVEVRKLRKLLVKAEESLYQRQHEAMQELQHRVDCLQQQYDRRRVAIVQEHIAERDSLFEQWSDALDQGSGDCVCQGCAKLFIPTNRNGIPGWKKCAIPDCQSCTSFCRDCSSTPCARCMAPTCLSHQVFHDLACQSDCKTCCGYDGFDLRVGIRFGCCAKPCTSKSLCQTCHKLRICQDCEYNTKGTRQCAVCSSKENSAMKKRERSVPWSAPAYERERKRRKFDYDAVVEGVDTTVAPISRVLISFANWKQDGN